MAALATESGHERRGFGVASVKVALLYIKEVYHGDMFQVHADTYEEDGLSAVTFWKKIGMYEVSDHQTKVVGQKLSRTILMEGEINSILSNIAGNEHHGCIIDAGSYHQIRFNKKKGLELRYSYEKYGWNTFAIDAVRGVQGLDPSKFCYKMAQSKLSSMGIHVDDVSLAVEKAGKQKNCVNLRAK